MCFSDDLRDEICKKYSINLKPYVWSNDLNALLINIELDRQEELVRTMDEVYHFGYNIGSCGLTSRYFAREFPKAELAYGILPILKGTKGSKTGNHAWIIKDGFVIDPTLKLIIPENVSASLGYSVEKILAHESARMLSEYETFSRLVIIRELDVIKFDQELLKID